MGSRSSRRLRADRRGRGYAGIVGGTRTTFCVARCHENGASELETRVVRERTSSHGGWYTYRREEPRDETPQVRRIRGAAIVRTADGPRVLGLLKELGTEVHAMTVQPTRRDASC